MKQVLLLALTTIALSQLGVAASCSSGTLATYVALGSGGCTIGGDTLYNFQVLTGTAGATAIANSLVTINPSGTTYMPALTISTSQTTTTNLLESIFTYDIAGPMYSGISAVLGGSSESGSGGVSGLVNVCEGGSFGSDGVTGCMQSNASLVTVDGVQSSDMATLNFSTFLNVTNDLTIGGGPASGATLTNSFTAVPEPFTSALTGLGLALVGAIRVRALRAKQ